MPVIYIKTRHYDTIVKLGKNPKDFIDELLERELKKIAGE